MIWRILSSVGGLIFNRMHVVKKGSRRANISLIGQKNFISCETCSVLQARSHVLVS